MAYLIGTQKIYLFVKREEYNTSTTASEHSVEEGENITDHVKLDAETVSLTGMLVGSGYKSKISAIKSWEKDGELIRYSGETILNKCRVKNFQVIHSSETAKGCDVTMELHSMRIAKPAYVASDLPTETKPVVEAGQQSVESNSSDDVYYTVKSGDTVWALVNGPYKKYGKSCNDIMSMNPGAFSRSGDFTTLQVGARLKMG